MRYNEIILESYPLAKKEWSAQNDPAEVADYIAKFRERVSRGIVKGEQTDINYWRKAGYAKFKAFVDDAMGKHSRKQLRQGKVQGNMIHAYSDDRYDVYIPLDFESNRFLTKQYDLPYCTGVEDGKSFSDYFGDLRFECDGLIYGIPKTENDSLFAIDFIVKNGQVHARYWDGGNEDLAGDDGEDSVEGAANFQKLTGIKPQTIDQIILKHKDEIAAANKKYVESRSQNKTAQAAPEPAKAMDEATMVLQTQDPAKVFKYLETTLKKPWPEAEPILKKDPAILGQYIARYKPEPWPEVEPILAKNARAAFSYSMALNKPFPAGQEAIYKDPEMGIIYASKYGTERLPPNVEAAALKTAWPLTKNDYITKFKLESK